MIYDPKLFDIKKVPKNQYPYLILDIDETLVSSFHMTDSSDISQEDLSGDFHKLNFENLAKVYLKVRPFAIEFIRQLNQYYQLVIYSHGKDFYVDRVARILDPRHEIFGKKNTFSRFGNEQVKSLENIGKKSEDQDFIILDDSYEVWKDKIKGSVHDKIIISKKFVAWKDKIDPRKLASVTIKESCTFGESQNEYYVDRNFHKDSFENSQLY